MMYHPGKVIEIFSIGKGIKSNDSSVQITLEMWDENIITFNISPKLGKIVKEGDIAIVDYSPKSEKLPIPKHEIVKVLQGTAGNKMWRKYKDFLKKRKPTATIAPQSVQKPSLQYIG